MIVDSLSGTEMYELILSPELVEACRWYNEHRVFSSWNVKQALVKLAISCGKIIYQYWNTLSVERYCSCLVKKPVCSYNFSYTVDWSYQPMQSRKQARSMSCIVDRYHWRPLLVDGFLESEPQGVVETILLAFFAIKKASKLHEVGDLWNTRNKESILCF